MGVAMGGRGIGGGFFLGLQIYVGAYGLIVLRGAASCFVTSEAPRAATELSLGLPGSKCRVEADVPSPDPYIFCKNLFSLFTINGGRG